MADNLEEQQEELEALKSIFDNEFNEISVEPPCFMVELTDIDVPLTAPLFLKVTMLPSYPEEVPMLEVPNRSSVLSTDQHAGLLQHLQGVALSNVGMAMVFTLVEEAKQWISDNVAHVDDQSSANQKQMQSDQDTQPVKVTLSEPKITGGRWDFVIGLVGKPSAGKSTFFNAATTLDLAKTGSHPFTTIEPNVGKAFYSVPCPCGHLGIRCSAAHGHSYAGERHVPVLLKDVAGLVPGACDGKGRGNRFLNDLLDADVLMHIVDVSGSTNEKGEKTIGYDPSQDVTWLQQEIHRWIYDNVMDKWDTIRRRPEKLIDMFTGYHANKATIHAAMQNAEIDARELSRVASWEAATLHRLVREFLRLRFPIFLVLNKADTETAQQNIQRLEESHPDIPRLAVSAKAENYLQSLAKAAVIQYEYGDSTFTVSSSVSPADKHKLDRISTEVLQRYGSSNVHRALCEAVRLRSPSYAFPVQCLDTLTSIDKFKDQAAGALRDCVTLRPGTTVEELYTAMMHYPLLLLAGDFIRAECLDDTGKKRIVRKDEVIDKYNCIIKIMTNRKVTQVKARD